MQEKFMRTCKKVAAIGTGIAMLGMTLTGASAVDLSNYPSGLGFGGSDTILVVGASAGDSASDNAAASDVASGLPSLGGTSATIIEGGVSEDIPIGKNIADVNYFDSELNDDDIETLQDTKISFVSNDYDIHETIRLNTQNSTATGTSSAGLTAGDTGVVIVSSLGSKVVSSGVEDDYESSVFLEVGSGALRYYYEFDDAINITKDVSTSNTLKLKFLGKTLKIVSVDSSNPSSKFTAYVGNEYFINQGESVVVDGKTVTLNNVGSGGAIAIDVDGVMEVISSSNTETVNGIEITNDEFFYTSAGKDQCGASLVIGKDASDSIQNGDYYPGGDEVCSNNDPEDPDCWKWIISGLDSGESSAIVSNVSGIDASGTIIGIKNKFNINNEDDNPPSVGDCISLPNNFVSICVDSLTVSDDNYMNMKISYVDDEDISDVYPDETSANVIKIEVSESEGLKIISSNLADANISKDVKTDTIYIEHGWGDDTGIDTVNTTRLLYLNNDNLVRFAGNISEEKDDSSSSGFIQVNYKDTKSTNIVFDWSAQQIAAGAARNTVNETRNLTINIIGDNELDLPNGWDDIQILVSLKSDFSDFDGLGGTIGEDDGNDTMWCANDKCMTLLGTKDEDHRSLYGIIIRDPKSHGSSDEVELDIPADQVMAKVVISGTVVSGGSDATTNAAVKLDSEVSDVTAYNVVLVGGPCANSLTAQLMGASTAWPACADGFTDGEAIIELKTNGDNYAVIAAGSTADDTRRAGVALGNYQEKLGSAVSGKSSVTVTGTGLTVEGISVA